MDETKGPHNLAHAGDETNGAVELPAAPVRLFGGREKLSGAIVSVRQWDGQEVIGRLERLDAAGRIVVRPGPDKPSLVLTFPALRYLTFPPVALAPVAEHDPQNLDPTRMRADEPQEFEVIYRDGKRLSGKTFGSMMDEKGLHLFRPLSDGKRVMRVFVPAPGVKDFRLGEKLGEALVNAGKIDRRDVETALKKQEELRSLKLGDYLHSDIAISRESLAEALKRQSRYPARRIGTVLVNEGLISTRQLNEALARQDTDRSHRLGDILIDMGVISPEDLHLTLARNLGIPYVKLRDFDIDTHILDTVTVELARKHSLLPLFLHDGRLVVAMEDPTDTEAISLLRFTTGHQVDVVVATSADVRWAIDKFYGPTGSAEALEELDLETLGERSQEGDLDDVEKLGKEKPVVKLVNSIIVDAIRQRASDIHLRAEEHEVELLFRIDGALKQITHINRKLLPAVVSRIKILGRMDISERRLPQDGRTRVSHEGSVVDLRISVIPTVYGESVVIRILDTRTGLKSLAEIGFGEADEEAFRNMLYRSNGLLLVTGPTGSGKSTTLYAALGEVRERNVNIITVEDPVEYHIDGIEQIQAHTAPGFTFARALRHILRHDPDVIMIGEIRDEETGKIAIESALTGHLVLSTLHTNDAATAVTRLMEMGVAPYLLSATLLGALAQRLVKKNCPVCMVEEQVKPMVRRALNIGEEEVFFRGAGCEQCNGTGYSGRSAVYELLRSSEALKNLIQSDVTAEEIRRQAIADGMSPLTEHALRLARQRITSLEEVYRVRLQ